MVRTGVVLWPWREVFFPPREVRYGVRSASREVFYGDTGIRGRYAERYTGRQACWRERGEVERGGAATRCVCLAAREVRKDCRNDARSKGGIHARLEK
jgi:hypothetical protein